MTQALWDYVFPAPAKLNLFLHVTGRRADGYHLLQTVFRLIDWQDTLRFSPRRDGRCVLADPVAGLPADDDLCVRAARALQVHCPHKPGVDIHLEKQIPMGGGLGGGSSDAATTLMALNRLWDLRLPRDELARVGLTLGADVPFFLFGENAFAEGVGEVLAPVQLNSAYYLVLVPPVQVPTKAVFASPTLTRNSKIVTISSFSDALSGFSRAPAERPKGWRPDTGAKALFGRNDLENAVCDGFPEVARHLAWLRDQAGGAARMSGSGACVFAEFDAEGMALAVARRMPPDMQGKVARGLDRHPIRELQGF